MQKRRVESPSSINSFKQCPRKYYYKYIQNLPTKPNIQQIRGKITHKVLETFYDIDTKHINLNNYSKELKQAIQNLLLDNWKHNRMEILNYVNSDQEKFYFSETMLMLLNWFDHFSSRVKSISQPTFQERFVKLTPIREREYSSNNLYVRGFIDAIEDYDDKVCILDYKTNTHLDIDEEQRLQLSIYSLLYKEAHGRAPDKAGIFFLRSKPKFIEVDDNLLVSARHEIEFVHSNTVSSCISSYPLKTGPLCKWCDFYCICFEQKRIKDYLAGIISPTPISVKVSSNNTS